LSPSPSALGPPPIPWIGFGGTPATGIRLSHPDDLPNSAKATPAGASRKPLASQCQYPSISAKEAATDYYSHRSTALGCSYRVLRQRKMAVAAVTAAERCDYGFVMQLIVNYIAY